MSKWLMYLVGIAFMLVGLGYLGFNLGLGSISNWIMGIGFVAVGLGAIGVIKAKLL